MATFLTAVLIENLLRIREERRFRPLRRRFLEDLGRRRITTVSFYVFAYRYDEKVFWITLLLEDVWKEFENLDQTIAKLARGERSTSQKDTNPKYFELARSLDHAASQVVSLSFDMDRIERMIDVYTSVLTPEMVNIAATISSQFSNQNSHFRCLSSFFRGYATQEERIKAKTAYIEMSKIISLFDSLADEAALADTKKSIEIGRNAAVAIFTQ
jgi:hypothetical protein